MKRFLLIYILLLILILFGTYSCKNNDPSTSKSTIVGIWKLEQEFSNNGNSDQLKEFPLSSCDKMTTLKVLKSGKYISCI